MRVPNRLLVLACFVLTAGICLGCGSNEAQINEAAEAESAWLSENKSKLDSLRQQLADLKAEAEEAAKASEEATEGEEEGAEPVDFTAQIQSLQAETDALSTELVTRVVNYLNTFDPMLEGEAPSERQVAVIRMKTDEDIIVGSEYIQKGGDYKRAIRIFNDALALDPDNEKLMAVLASAEENRFITEERLALVNKGMTQDEVRAALGQVNLRNIREYPERDVIAWFYPIDDTGDASAVWFRKNKAEEYVVYRTNFEEVRSDMGADTGEG